MEIKLITLLREVVNEVGDLKNITPYDYELTNNGGKFTFVEDGEVLNVEVKIEDITNQKEHFMIPPVLNPKNKNLYNVSYTVNGNDRQFIKSNPHILIKILKTVTEIIKNIISKYENPIFVILAQNKIEGIKTDLQKFNYYKLILMQNIPTGYRYSEGKDLFTGMDALYISKIK